MAGYYIKTLQIKESAVPIDNITKFAWDDDDYEEIEVWHEITEEEQEWMDSLKQESNSELDIQCMLIDQEFRLTLLELGLMEV